MMKKKEIGIIITRLVLGIIFIIHGLDKFQSGIGNIAGWFESIGLPGFTAYIVAIIELFGGIALILGLGTRYVSMLIALVMLGAMFKVKLAAGFLGGYELDVILLAVSIQLALTGSGQLSIDQWISRSKETAIEG